MPAKHKTHTKKTTRRRLTVRRQTGEPQTTVIPDVPVQSVQPNQPLAASPAQPSQSTQPVQPTQPTMTPPTQPQQPLVQSAPLSFGNPITVTSGVGDAEIKIGTENSSGVVPEQSQSAVNAPDDPSGNSSGTQPSTGDPVKEDNKNQDHEKKNLLLPIIFIVLLGVAVLGGLFIYRQNFSNNQKEKVNVVSLSPTPKKEPTPKPIDLSKYTISVLNGSETDGAASNLKSNLEGEGFEVPSIGNADSSEYTETVIQAKENVDKEYLAKLKTTLEESFTVGKIQTLDEDAETDVVVIIGSKTAE